jgi:hypothetical protein
MHRLTELLTWEGSWHFEDALTSDIPRGERYATDLLTERLLICRCGSAWNIRRIANACPAAKLFAAQYSKVISPMLPQTSYRIENALYLYSGGNRFEFIPLKSRYSDPKYLWFFLVFQSKYRRGSVVGWGTMLQAGRSRVRVPTRWNFSSFHPHYGPRVDSASNRNEYQESSWGVKEWPACKTDNLTFTDCLENVGASMSHNPMGLHGLLQG